VDDGRCSGHKTAGQQWPDEGQRAETKDIPAVVKDDVPATSSA
jgi:hypothetical protein